MPYRHLQLQLQALAVPHPAFATLPKVVVLLAAAVAWLNARDINAAAATVMATGLTVTSGVMLIRVYWKEHDREQKRKDLEERINEMKLLDAARHDSLSAQLDEAKALVARQADESTSNQKKMRDTLHDINNQLNAAHVENEVLRRDLATANANFIRVSEQLSAANSRVIELAAEIHRLNRELEHLPCRVLAEQGAAGQKAVQDLAAAVVTAAVHVADQAGTPAS